MQQFNVSGCQKTVSETTCYLLPTIESPTCLAKLTAVQRISSSIFLLILISSIFIVIQKLQCMQEFIFVINEECLHSNLQAKLLLHNWAHANHAKTCICDIQ